VIRPIRDLVLLACLLLVPLRARAAEGGAELKHGSELYASGDYKGAIAVWEPLYQLLGEKSGWKILYGLGLAYEKTGDATRAVERFEGFTRHLADDPAALDQSLESAGKTRRRAFRPSSRRTARCDSSSRRTARSCAPPSTTIRAASNDGLRHARRARAPSLRRDAARASQRRRRCRRRDDRDPARG